MVDHRRVIVLFFTATFEVANLFAHLYGNDYCAEAFQHRIFILGLTSKFGREKIHQRSFFD